MNYTRQQKVSKRALGGYIIITILVLFVLGPRFGITKIGTYGLLPLLSVIGLSLSIKKGQYLTRKHEFYCLIFLFFLSLTGLFYYEDLPEMIANMTRLLGAILGAYCALSLSQAKNNFQVPFHVAYVLLIAGLFIVMVTNGNFVLGIGLSSSKLLRDVFMLNANSYSYYSFFANISLFILFLQYKNLITKIALGVFPILFILISFATQSRSGLLFIVLSNLVFWLFIFKTNNKNPFKKLATSFITLVAIVFAIYQFTILLLQSDFSKRLSVKEDSSQERTNIMIEGINYFLEYPFTGVGIGQYPIYSKYGLFTHNSFIEAFAEQGFIAGILVLIIFIRPLIISFSLFKKHRQNPEVKVQFLFFIVFALFNNFYVFYKFSFAMIFHFIMIGYQQQTLRNLQIKDET